MTQTKSVSSVAVDKPITGHLKTWGVWERLVPEEIGPDASSQSALEIHLNRYVTAGHHVVGKKVLDIASGTGFGSKMLKDIGAEQVIGVDIAPESIAYAQDRYGTPGVSFHQADAEKFEWPELFDVVVTYETIEHVPHPDLFLNRLRQLIKPDGQLFLSVPLGETRHIDPYHLHAFDQEGMFQLIEAAGFDLQAYRVEPWKCTRADAKQMRQSNPGTMASLKDLLFSSRGRRVLRDYATKGCVSWDWLLVQATPRPAGQACVRGSLKPLDA